jgi:hypothetical protein
VSRNKNHVAGGSLELRSGLTMAGLCSRLHKLGVLAPARSPGEAREDNAVFASPRSLVEALATSGRFTQDSALGAILHGKKASFREISSSDSLHVVFDGDRVSAHIDLVSPLDLDPERPRQYAPLRVVAHNLTGAATSLWRLVV